MFILLLKCTHLAIGSAFGLASVTFQHALIVCCTYFHTFCTKTLQLIWLFPFYSPEPVISSRSPGSFRWRMVLEAMICVLGALIASRVQLLLGCFKREQENISKCIFKHICTYFFICMYSKNHKLILISSILILQYKIYSSFSPFFTFSSFYS